MPNWVYHRMRLTGAAHDLTQFASLIQTVHQDGEPAGFELDFNVWLPMPASLDLEAGSRGQWGEALLGRLDEPLEGLLAAQPWCAPIWRELLGCFTDRRPLTAGDLVRWAESQPAVGPSACPTPADTALRELQGIVRLGRQRLQNLERHGHADWYGWSLQHWGTKWNGGECEMHRLSEGSLELWFQTAWTPPLPVLQQIARAHPGLSGEVCYLDEGLGFAGLCRFGAEVPGGFVDEATDTERLAREVFGWELAPPASEPAVSHASV